MTGNTSLKTIAGELGPKHTGHIRNIGGEINPFSFPKKEYESSSATEAERFEHLTKAMERNEPIYSVTSLDF